MTPPADFERASPFALRVLDVLTRYVSVPTARSLLELGTRRQSIPVSALAPRDMERLKSHLRDGLTLFVPNAEQIAQCMAALEKLASPDALRPEPSDRVQIALRAEEDIVKARTDARAMALRAGFSEIARTRVATAVSELARNIVRYAGEGTLTLSLTADTRGDALIEIVAVDRGPGISDLASILGGTYRSQHGMGLGLRGVKRISQHFDVQTAPNRGTRVHARIAGMT